MLFNKFLINSKSIPCIPTFFEFNYTYYPGVSFKDEVNPYSRSCSTNKLAKKLKNLILIC